MSAPIRITLSAFAAAARAAVITLALGLSAVSVAQTPSMAATGADSSAQRETALEVALVTIGPGEIYWQRFGHNAILIVERDGGRATLYNFGMFDFAEDDFLVNFARGRMTYFLVAGPPGPDFNQYRNEGRSVELDWLALEPSEALALKTALDDNARPENAAYRYDYFRDNCSTRVRDALDRALGGAIRIASVNRSRGFTFRMHARRLTGMDLPLYLGIDAGLGPMTDRPITFWDEMFVPMRLRELVLPLTRPGKGGVERALVLRSETLLESRHAPPPARPSIWVWRFLLIGSALAALLLWLGAGRDGGARRRGLGVLAGTLWLIAGSAGLVLGALMLATEHEAAWHNENVLLFSPLALALLPIAWRALRGRAPGGRVIRWIAVAILGLALWAWLTKVLPGVRQDNLDWIAFWLPIHAALAWVIWRAPRRPPGGLRTSR